MSFRIIIDARTSDAQYVGQSEMQSSEITKKQNNLLWHSMSRVVAPKAKVCKIYLAFAQTGILNVP
jgi:hypothetical protein